MIMKTGIRLQSGYTLIEVLVGILIFSLGILALAQLQGNLSKSSAESNARTVAINIAEEEVESVRAFSQLTASNTVDAFNNIVSGTETIRRGNIDYAVTSTVTDYYHNPATGEFQTAKPHSEIVNPDLKRLQLTVTWGVGDAAQTFQIDASNSTSGMGTGSVTMVDLISSFTTSTGAKVVLNSAGDTLYAPPVSYNPGQNPDIISIQLGANKFKESTTPLPDVIRADELVETTFDVVTYSQDGAGATFLRREEFRAVSCECTLRSPNQSTEGGLRPTIWEGYEYTEAEYVSKPYGESANNQQSQFCSLCCRDHHDGGTGSEDVGADPGRSRYNAFRSGGDYEAEGAMSGDHEHYNRDRNGEMALANDDGDTYVEACRMIRKDGFWRIGQDLRQEGLNAFPADYLDDSSEVSKYSSYVTGSVSAYEHATDPSNSSQPTNAYESNPPTLTQPKNMTPSVVFPASTLGNPTTFPTEGGGTEQQLRARGIYVDYLSDDLRARINCLDRGGSGEDCDVPDVTSALEIIPFYDVQLTWLARWNETPNNNPIDVTNEAIADDNAHDRGIASLESGFGYSTINSAVHTGNLGLTGTDPVDPWYNSDEESYNLYALAIDYSSPPPLSGIIVSGDIQSSVGGVKATDVEIEATGAQCDRTNTGFECVIEIGAANPRLTVSNYGKANMTLFACSAQLEIHGQEHIATNGTGNWTRFNLPAETIITVDIVIKENSCG